MVSIEFAEAWPVDWETNLDGKYVMVMGDDGYMANNDMASVRDGNEYSFQGNNSTTIDVTSTVIEWTEITGTGIKIMMDYTTFNHIPGNGSHGLPSTGFIVPSAFEICVTATNFVFSESKFSKASISKSPLSKIGITLSVAPETSQHICQGTILA
jgi:hypothetical protein